VHRQGRPLGFQSSGHSKAWKTSPTLECTIRALPKRQTRTSTRLELTPQLILGLANFGVSAVFAIVLLNLYAKQSRDIMKLSQQREGQLVALVEKNTAAITALQSAVSALCDEMRRERRK